MSAVCLQCALAVHLQIMLTQVFSCSFWMGAFNGKTAKRHRLWSNDRGLMDAIFAEGALIAYQQAYINTGWRKYMKILIGGFRFIAIYMQSAHAVLLYIWRWAHDAGCPTVITWCLWWLGAQICGQAWTKASCGCARETTQKPVSWCKCYVVTWHFSHIISLKIKMPVRTRSYTPAFGKCIARLAVQGLQAGHWMCISYIYLYIYIICIHM